MCVTNGISEPRIEVTGDKILSQYGGVFVVCVCVWYHVCHGYVKAHGRLEQSERHDLRADYSQSESSLCASVCVNLHNLSAQLWNTEVSQLKAKYYQN